MIICLNFHPQIIKAHKNRDWFISVFVNLDPNTVLGKSLSFNTKTLKGWLNARIALCFPPPHYSSH